MKNERAIDRLISFVEYLIEAKEVNSIRDFEELCGLSNGYIANSNKANGSIGSNMMERIVAKFPSFSLLWLCSGKGNMIVEQILYNVNYKEAYEGAMMQIDALRKIIDEIMNDTNVIPKK